MKEMLLFGAGASKEAGVPTAYGLTNEIANEFRQQPHLARHARVVSFVLGGLLFNRGIQGDDPLSSGVNVEEFFNAIQLLADRSTLEAAPFVGSWHSMVEEFDKVQPPAPHSDRLQEIIFRSVTEKIFASVPSNLPAFGASDIDKKLEDLIKKSIESEVKGRSKSFSSSNSVGREVGDFVIEIVKKWTQNLKQARPSGSEFEREFKKAIDQQSRPGEGRIFREVADQMIRMLAKFVFVSDTNRVSHLAPVKNLSTSQPRITIASLNYDNCVELFCENAGIRCDTGIDQWSKSGTFDMQGEGVLLLKLHGSIDWQSKDGRSPDRPMPHRVITRVSPEFTQKNSYWPALIFGHRNKLTAEGPFLDLLRAFQRELANADRLTIVGYSFADVHINVYLSHWLNNGSERRLRIIDPAFGQRQNDYTKELLDHATRQIEVLKEPAGKALQTLFPAADSGPLK
jgi:SIR2-like domain